MGTEKTQLSTAASDLCGFEVGVIFTMESDEGGGVNVSMDEGLARFLEMQQVRQKQEVCEVMELQAATNADTEFRRGLEELVREHLDRCMVIASCSSAHDGGTPSYSSVHDDNGSSHSEHMHILGSMNEVGESHMNGSSESVDAHQQLHQFGLPVDVSGQSEHEREHDEAGEDEASQHSSPQPLSQVVSRWDDRQAQEMMTTMERQARESELLALASLHTVSMLDASFLRESASPRSDNSLERPQRRLSSLVQMWRGLEEDHGSGPSFERQTNETLTDEPMQQEQESDRPSEEVVDIGEAERERVRHIMQRWMSQAGPSMDTNTTTSPSHNNSAAQFIGEGERERIRQLARDWVRASSQQSALISHAQPQHTSSSSPPTQPHVQITLDLLITAEEERQRELQRLSEHRAVSHFAHRSRLQSFLRGRFLRNGASLEEERPPSLAAGEIGQLRQRRAVSGLREGFRYRLETILSGQVNHRPSETEQVVQDVIRRRRDGFQVAAPSSRRILEREAVPLGVGRDWHGITAARRIRELQDITDDNVELRELLNRRSVTTVLASEFRDRLDLLIESFIQRSGHSSRPWNFPRSRSQRPEIRQQEQQQVQGGEVHGDHGPNEVRNDDPPPPPDLPPPPQLPAWARRATPLPPRLPAPPPPPLPATRLYWAPAPQQPPWTHRDPQHPAETQDVQNGSGLRAAVVKLQQGLGNLQHMLETCMDMQLELQRSVRQEVSGALHRAYGSTGVPEWEIDGSKWLTVKNGTCCICCDKYIDSLLYRCGHMCTCLKCANEMLKNSGKCPMCRAPIVEVVRAFTVA